MYLKQMVEHLPRRSKVLSSNPSTAKNMIRAEINEMETIYKIQRINGTDYKKEGKDPH
jgi:hypothetical protein